MIELGEEMKKRRKGGGREYKQEAEWGAALRRQEGYKRDRRPDKEEKTAVSHAQGHSEVWAGSCGLRVMALPCGETEGIERSGFHPSPVALGSPYLSSMLSAEPKKHNSSLAELKGTKRDNAVKCYNPLLISGHPTGRNQMLPRENTLRPRNG